ncbi:hypothetical protein PROFUN_06571 [Planoprotostelium fungivorum]|uniref:Uncharacterized protein n=1 Tax=Planoprotostelium fungivorum TaxID=1890364 RepID=A0A2P6MRW3_9EUKA|nr:hypothetical protein PROFUN_06571 [Planoprotostelium fungivorum]
MHIFDGFRIWDATTDSSSDFSRTAALRRRLNQLGQRCFVFGRRNLVEQNSKQQSKRAVAQLYEIIGQHCQSRLGTMKSYAIRVRLMVTIATWAPMNLRYIYFGLCPS